jgi:hypothetical protein
VTHNVSTLASWTPQWFAVMIIGVKSPGTRLIIAPEQKNELPPCIQVRATIPSFSALQAG